tara:strand:- start:811 stop:1032 length:222 start_codon:yes stop_codon:yes gene_type:complete
MPKSLLPTYFETNPMSEVATFYGLDWDDDVLPATGGDMNVNYGQSRRWTIKGVVISIYRSCTGRYELTHYKSI